MSHELLRDGVCTDHANLTPSGAMHALPDIYRDRMAGLKARLEVQFYNGVPLDDDAVRWGLLYEPWDSEEGRRVRATSIGLADPNEVTIHNPLTDMAVDRVSKEDFNDAFGIENAPRGVIISGAGGKK